MRTEYKKGKDPYYKQRVLKQLITDLKIGMNNLPKVNEFMHDCIKDQFITLTGILFWLQNIDDINSFPLDEEEILNNPTYSYAVIQDHKKKTVFERDNIHLIYQALRVQFIAERLGFVTL